MHVEVKGPFYIKLFNVQIIRSRFRNNLDLRRCDKTFFTGRLDGSSEIVNGVNLDSFQNLG